MIQAQRVAALPIRNEKGYYPENVPAPVFASASDLSDFIRDRTAAWKEHVQRQKERRSARMGSKEIKKGPVAGRKPGSRLRRNPRR